MKAMSKKDAQSIMAKFPQKTPYQNSFSTQTLAEEALKEYGLEINDDQEYEYVNKEMTLSDPDILIHNCHHFAVSPKNLRLMPDFGLGNSPDSYYDLEMEVSQKEANIIESLASCLDYLRSYEDKYRLMSIQYTLKASDLQLLYKLGLITLSGKINRGALREDSESLSFMS